MPNLKYTEEEIKQLFDKALELISQGNHPEAKKHLLMLLEYFPKAFLLNYNLGICFFIEESYKLALNHYENALTDYPGHQDTIYNLGLCYKKLDKIEEAITCFEALSGEGDHEILYNLAGCYRVTEQFPKAKDYYEKVLILKPCYKPAISNLAYTCHRMGEIDNAKELYRQLLTLDPEHTGAKHMLKTISHDNSGHTEIEYVRELFDHFSDHFDKSLTQNLSYQVPQLIKAEVKNAVQKKNSAFRHTLDLGCGTGLIGEELKDLTQKITGIDISPKMVEKAKEKHIYDNLYVADINELQLNDPFDLIIAADVFSYIGELNTTFSHIKDISTAETSLIFSIEKLTTNENIRLEKTGRYSHSLDYIKALAKRHSMEFHSHQDAKLRKESGVWVAGYICVITI
ncbi:MAG: tetratricopeptide repeat protein [Desulfotalea sp.]